MPTQQSSSSTSPTLLDRVREFDADAWDRLKLLTALATADIPTIATKRDGLPAELVSVVDRMLAKQPADRFATPQELAAALAPFAHDADLSSLLDCAERTEGETPVDQSAVGTHDHITSGSKDTEPTLDRTLQSDSAAEQPVAELSTVDWGEASPLRTTKPSVSQSTMSEASGSWNRTNKIFATLAGMAALLAALTVITIQTDKGTIKFVSYDPEIEVTIRRNGEVVDGYEVRQRDGATSYFSGDYEIEIKGGKPDGVSITNDKFKLTRGKKVLVEITRVREVASAAPKPAPQAVKWQPGPAENVLPGIVPRPAKLPGIKRWQIETMVPRTYSWTVVWSPDDSKVAVGTEAGEMRIYDAQTMQLLSIVAGNGSSRVMAICWSRNGRYVAFANYGGPLHLWDTETRTSRDLSDGDKNFFGVSFAPDGSAIAAAGESGIVIFDEGGNVQQRIQVVTPGPIVWSPDGTWIACSPDNGRELQLLRANGQKGAQLYSGDGNVNDLDWNDDGTKLAASIEDDIVRVWGVSGNELLVAKFPGCRSVALSPDGSRLAACNPGEIRIFDMDGEVQKVIRSPIAHAVDVDWSHDTNNIAIVGDGGAAVVPFDGQVARSISGHAGSYRRFTHYHPKQGLVAIGGPTTRVFSSIGSFVREVPGTRPHWSSDGVALATASGVDGVGVTTTFDSKGDSGLSLHNAWGAVWSPDNTLLASLYGPQLRIWGSDGSLKHKVDVGERGSAHDFPLAWHPSGELLLVGSVSGLLFVTKDGQVQKRISDDDIRRVRWVSWSQDGEWLASVGYESVLLNRDGTERVLLRGGSGTKYCVEWTPDGQRLATGANDRRVRIWESEGTLIGSLSGHACAVCSVTWSPDGRQIVSGGDDNSAMAWDAGSRTPEWVYVDPSVAKIVAMWRGLGRFATRVA